MSVFAASSRRRPRLRDEKAIPRKSQRSMGRMSHLRGTGDRAISGDDAGIGAGVALVEPARLRHRVDHGQRRRASAETFETMLPERDLSRLSAMKFFQCLFPTPQP